MATHFDLTDVQLIVNVGDSLSLTRAAEKTHLSVPAASMRIKNLEDYFRTRLLYRTNQGVTLTRSGEELMRHARILMAQVEQLHGDMQEFARGVKGRLRVLGNTTAMMEVMPNILSRFLASHPDVDLELRECGSQAIAKAVSEGSADVGIVAGCPPAENLHYLPCRDDRLVLIVPSGHVLEGREAVSFVETLTFDYVGLSEWSAIHGFLLRAASAAGRQFRFRAEMGNFDAVCRMIEATVGIGVIPESVARRLVPTMRITAIALTDSWALRRLHVCVRDLEALPFFARELVDMFAAEGRAGEAVEVESPAGV
ncbi:MAG TPA: LysR family transcriptional regulator [Paraburkholderia sp.]|nr:LysR family transcriptional regulator [Paraburkholderia sp.]